MSSDRHDKMHRAMLARIDAWLDGELDAAQIQELRDWINADPAHARIFVEKSFIHSRNIDLFKRADLQNSASSLFSKMSSQMNLSPSPQPLNVRLKQLRLERRRRNVRQLGLAAASIAAALLISLFVWQPWAAAPSQQVATQQGTKKSVESGGKPQSPALPSRRVHSLQLPSVAMIIESASAKWADASISGEVGTRLAAGPLYLVRGMVKIRLQEGAEVLLAAPAKFRLETESDLRMEFGKVVAYCPKEAEGFTVRTADGYFTDLGTRFGVLAAGVNFSEVHVFDGEVLAGLGNKTLETKREFGGMSSIRRPWRVRKNQALRLVADSAEISRIDFNSELFQRKMLRHLGITNIICGGNGLGDEYERGISVSNGAITKTIRAGGSRHGCRPVKWHPMIDSVFIPDGRKTVEIDTRGTIFTECPKTDGRNAAAIWCGKRIIPPGHQFYLDTRMGEVEYGVDEHRLLWMHSNKGITFDLDAVAKGHNGIRPVRFTAVAQNKERRRFMQGYDYDAKVDIWVLLDGKVAFVKKGMINKIGHVNIDVSIPAKTRMLSLVVTDGGDRNKADWVIFGDPRFVMKKSILSTSKNSTKSRVKSEL